MFNTLIFSCKSGFSCYCFQSSAEFFTRDQNTVTKACFTPKHLILTKRSDLWLYLFDFVKAVQTNFFLGYSSPFCILYVSFLPGLFVHLSVLVFWLSVCFFPGLFIHISVHLVFGERGGRRSAYPEPRQPAQLWPSLKQLQGQPHQHRKLSDFQAVELIWQSPK